MTRWVLYADGIRVGVSYDSEEKAWKKAREYELHCLNQDYPFCPKMSVEKEETE